MQFTEWIPAPNNWENLKFHPFSELVGFGVGIDIEGLARHMKEHGFDDNEPIVIWRDMILDGRGRHAAAKLAGVVPMFARFVGRNPEAYVAKKAFRAHLTQGQRALVAGKMAISPPNGGEEKSPPNGGESEPAPNPGKTAKNTRKAAKAMKVSTRTAERAKVVIEGGTKKLIKAVADDKVKISDAEKIAKLPPKAQDRCVKAVLAGDAKTVAEVAFPVCERCKSLDKPIADCGACAHLHERFVANKKPDPKKIADKVFDDAGTVVPIRLIPMFREADKFKQVEKLFDKASKLCKEIENSKLFKELRPLEGKKHYGELFGALKNSRFRVRAMRPALICPACDGESCDKCCDGVLTKEMADLLGVKP